MGQDPRHSLAMFPQGCNCAISQAEFSSEVQPGKDLLPRSCTCWQNQSPCRLLNCRPVSPWLLAWDSLNSLLLPMGSSHGHLLHQNSTRASDMVRQTLHSSVIYIKWPATIAVFYWIEGSCRSLLRRRLHKGMSTIGTSPSPWPAWCLARSRHSVPMRQTRWLTAKSTSHLTTQTKSIL